ncbi:MAG TPA: flagellar type III secretion system pore protein FliP [Limnochordales bacterium]|nr:flagellar type III secretion system pore protein FliP [Limnochordales bacterium]
MKRWAAGLGAAGLAVLVGGAARAQGAGIPFPRIELGIAGAEGPADVALTLQILALLTVLTLAPAILVMLTSFTRIVVVLSFVRSALALQQMPPNQVIIGLALFLTFFTMAPTWQAVFEQGLQPYLAGELSQEETLERVSAPLRSFMLQHTRERDLELFVELAGVPRPETEADVPTYVLIPAFVISELRTAFQLGFILFIPFLVIDMVVASTLMSMGMLMLPPVMISLPFKVLLFVMVDGWHLITRSLLVSFQ